MDGNCERVVPAAAPVRIKPRRPLLLEAWSRGRYAAQVGFDITNPYARNGQMSAAWIKGWESVQCDCD